MNSLGIPALLFFLVLFSCRKESFITSPDARVRITADTLKYDTVFVSAGSVYQTFKVINENEQKLRISSIKLMGGPTSSYKINVDGISGVQFSNLELEPNDSVYIFAQVNIDPSAANLPFIIRDSIEIIINGTKRFVQLEAWGQNAHFLRNKVITASETWNNDLPYVILGSLLINANQTLTINKGCRIYVHADAPIIVNGSLVVNGAKDTIDRVYFQGDRLDEPYKFFPAAWPGIFFQANSSGNIFNYAVIRNAFQAIALTDPSATGTKLVMNETIIDNSYAQGIIAINSSIRARNCLISNCGNNIALVKGGNYEFTHCTVATYGNRYIELRQPLLILTDYLFVNNVPVIHPLNASFTNCIFWGENGFIDTLIRTDKLGSAYNVSFNGVLWKVPIIPPHILPPTNVINNIPPGFDSINTFRNYYSFRLKDTSRAIDRGVNAGVTIDLDGLQRPKRLAPDLGAYERQN